MYFSCFLKKIASLKNITNCWRVFVWGETSHLSRISHLSKMPIEWHFSLFKNKSLIIWEWINPIDVRSHLNLGVFTCNQVEISSRDEKKYIYTWIWSWDETSRIWDDFIPGWNFAHNHPLNFIPGWNLEGGYAENSILGRNHPCLWWNVAYCLHVFAEMKLNPGVNSSLSKWQGWNFIPGWSFIMSMFLLNFWRMCSICFPTLTCLNIMKVKLGSH